MELGDSSTTTVSVAVSGVEEEVMVSAVWVDEESSRLPALAASALANLRWAGKVAHCFARSSEGNARYRRVDGLGLRIMDAEDKWKARGRAPRKRDLCRVLEGKMRCNWWAMTYMVMCATPTGLKMENTESDGKFSDVQYHAGPVAPRKFRGRTAGQPQ